MDDPKSPPGADRCPDCGAPVAGGRAGCQGLWDAFNLRALSDIHYARVRDLAFDTYCMQHLQTYCRSAKSYAAHLTRLCCGLEYGGDPGVYSAIQRWLNGTATIQRPQNLSYLGDLTIASLQPATSSEEAARLVRAWAENVWQAYTSQHEIARAWIHMALNGPAR